MTKIIELTDLVITSMLLDYAKQRIIVDFWLVDAEGKSWEVKNAVFWVTIPDTGPFGGEVPENWFLLPPTYIPTLLSLQADADAALTAKYLS